MSITWIGVIVIPVSLVLFLAAPRYLIPCAIAASVFQAASVVNIAGGFPIGVTPYFFVLLMISLRLTPLWMSGRLVLNKDPRVRDYLRYLSLLVIWGVISGNLLPTLFSGMPVDSPRAGMDSAASSPLTWGWSNAAQPGYLLLDYVFIISVIWQAEKDRFFVTRCIAAFRWSGAFVAVVGIYQWFAHIRGLPFPTSFFNSNLAWAQLTDQQIGRVWRVSATFTEPSAAGAFFSVWTTMVLFSITGDKHVPVFHWCLLLSGIIMLALTTSTTGYLVGAVVLIIFFGQQILQLLIRGVPGRKALLAASMIGGGLVVGVFLLPDISHVLREVILHKSQTRSGRDRLATSIHAFDLVVGTAGLGVGLGSDRPSGMLCYVAGNLGLTGLILFGYIVFLTRQLTLKASAVLGSPHADRFMANIRACGWAFAIEIFATCAAGAEITAPTLWVCWGMLLATCTQAHVSSPGRVDLIASHG
jgi:hypothetical protein